MRRESDCESGAHPGLLAGDQGWLPAGQQEPSFEEAASAGASKGIKALGDYYAQWGRIVLGSVGQLQGVNNHMLARLHRQLNESRDQVDQLVGAILENRFNELQAARGRDPDWGDSWSRWKWLQTEGV